MEEEVETWISAAAAIIQMLHLSVKTELTKMSKLATYQSVYVPTLTCGHEIWILTKTKNHRHKRLKLAFIARWLGSSLEVSWEGLGVEPLFLHI